MHRPALARATALVLGAAAATGAALGQGALPPEASGGTTASADAARAAAVDRRLARRNAVVIAAGSAAFALYGWRNWWEDGFGGGFKSRDEGWFGAGTESGGADKLGHGYTNYANVRLLTPLFEAVGNGHGEAVRLAAWTTVGIFTAIEVADGYSRRYDFSPQDAAMNLLGAGLGVLMELDPDLDRKFDFRFAYRRSPGSDFSPFGDYAGQRYLLVAKADGFVALRDVPVLQYLELGLGYQARGFDPGGERRRELSLSVSLNLSRLLADGAYGGRRQSTPLQRTADRAFDLLQWPTEAVLRRRLD
jgi:hypothetical protein